jgi:ribosomal protein L11 methyltransferase
MPRRTREPRSRPFAAYRPLSVLTSRRPRACAAWRIAIGSEPGSPIGSRCVSADGCGFVPTAADAPEDPNAVVVRLDPGLAFGTGTHPTTALCLQILESLPLTGRSVVDYGCGSGILGIAALKMGASHVVAVDLDPQALIATRENAVRNGVSSAIDVAMVPVQLLPASCVVANILAGPLIELASTLTAACEAGADLLLSGLLKTQAYAVKAAYASGFDMVQVVGRDDWCCIHARRAA